MSPVTKATVIEHLQLISDNKRNMALGKAFLEHKQAAYTTIAILERMDAFETDVKIKDVGKSLWAQLVILR